MSSSQLLRQSQRGISLIESLVAIVIAALGILGVLGVQMRTMSDTSTTVRRAQAIRLIEDLGERLKTNPNALSNIASYTSAFGNTPRFPQALRVARLLATAAMPHNWLLTMLLSGS